MRKHEKHIACMLVLLLISVNLIGCSQQIQVSSENLFNDLVLQEALTESSSMVPYEEDGIPFIYRPEDIAPHASLPAAYLEFNQKYDR